MNENKLNAIMIRHFIARTKKADIAKLKKIQASRSKIKSMNTVPKTTNYGNNEDL